jgi:NIMA-interacting peptidyl-prolyl cis-trans isomerase 1
MRHPIPFPLLYLCAAVGWGLGLAGCDSPPPPARDAHAVPSASAEPAEGASATRTTSAPPPAPAAPPATPPAPAAPPATPPAPATASATAASASSGGAGERATQITARHVLIQYMGAQHAGAAIVRTKEQALAVAQEVLRRAKSGEDFARLAVEFSDEPGASARGGSLGRFGHGQMVHEFEDAAFALSPGQISAVVETPFGFHIIQRTE